MVALAGNHMTLLRNVTTRQNRLRLAGGRASRSDEVASGRGFGGQQAKIACTSRAGGADGAHRGAPHLQHATAAASTSSRYSETSGTARLEPCGAAWML